MILRRLAVVLLTMVTFPIAITILLAGIILFPVIYPIVFIGWGVSPLPYGDWLVDFVATILDAPLTLTGLG